MWMWSKKSGLEPSKPSTGAKATINIFSKPPAVAWPFTIMTRMASSIFFWSTAGGWRVSPLAKSRDVICSRTIATERSPTSPSDQDSNTTGWGQACCVGDYNNDGYDDLFVTYFGQNALYRNNGDGTFTDVTKEAGLIQPGPKIRWNTGCTFVDYYKDGHLDLFVANYVDFDLKTAPKPEAGPCTYKGILVACGPPGLRGGKNIFYHNNGDGTFTDVSEKAGIWKTNGTYGLSVAASRPWITMAGPISMSPTIPAPLRSTRIRRTEPSATSLSSPAPAVSPKESRKRGWAFRLAITIATATWTWSRRICGRYRLLYTNLGDATFEDRRIRGLGVNTRLPRLGRRLLRHG